MPHIRHGHGIPILGASQGHPRGIPGASPRLFALHEVLLPQRCLRIRSDQLPAAGGDGAGEEVPGLQAPGRHCETLGPRRRRKWLVELICWEGRISHRGLKFLVWWFVPTYIHTYVRTYLPTYLPTDRQTDRHTYIHTYMCIYISIYRYMHIYICITSVYRWIDRWIDR